MPQEETMLSQFRLERRVNGMRIKKDEIVAGYSALQVRGFLRRFEFGFFMLSAAEGFMQLKSREAEEFVNNMVALNLIEPTMPFEGRAAFHVATRGHALANATAAKPISRGTADRVLREFMDRMKALNASKKYAFKVRSAVLFGSMLSSVDRLGDVDVAIDLQRRISDSARFRQQCDRRRHLAEEQGREFATAIEWATWPEREVVLQLKGRSHCLSLHGFDQLTEMNNLRYRILVGDANLIASHIPNGFAA
jgi:hypothetical protein